MTVTKAAQVLLQPRTVRQSGGLSKHCVLTQLHVMPPWHDMMLSQLLSLVPGTSYSL